MSNQKLYAIAIPMWREGCHSKEDMMEIVDAVAAAVREDCAKLCELTYPEPDGEIHQCFDTGLECAGAIRMVATLAQQEQSNEQ